MIFEEEFDLYRGGVSLYFHIRLWIFNISLKVTFNLEAQYRFITRAPVGAATRLFITRNLRWIPLFYTDFFIYNHAYVHQNKNLFTVVLLYVVFMQIGRNYQKPEVV